MPDAPQMIFVNLPVRDLEKSKEFFTSLGYTINLTYTDENASCIVISDTILVMLLTESYFVTFTNKPVSDARKQAEVIIALSSPSRADVDAMLEKALKAGAKEPQPARDYGFMYQRSFEDLDGHLWEVVHMQGEPS